MTKDINKQILTEKSRFITNNSTFFYKNLNNKDILNNLKEILLNPAPLTQCPTYNELIAEIKESKTKNINELTYTYSFETLFAIVNLVRIQSSSQAEVLRQYVKYINDEANGKMYYSTQSIIKFDKGKADQIIKEQKQYKKVRRNRI